MHMPAGLRRPQTGVYKSQTCLANAALLAGAHPRYRHSQSVTHLRLSRAHLRPIVGGRLSVTAAPVTGAYLG
jgi:hypothetical protein